MRSAATQAGVWSPGPGTPVFPRDRLRPDAAAAAAPRFGDDTWNLWHIDHRETGGPGSVNWRSIPSPFRSACKRAFWFFLNVDTPSIVHDRGAGSSRLRVKPNTQRTRFVYLREFASWLDQRDVGCLGEVTDADLIDYAVHLTQQHLQPVTHQQKLWTVTLLWAYGDHLPAGDRIPTPPWFPKIGDYVRPASCQGENSTAPIHPATMSPLLVWALRFVTDYADDILAGFDEAHRLYTGIPLSPTPDGQRRLRRYAEQLAATGRGWPRDSYSKDRPWISSTFIAGTVGVSHHDVETFLRWHRHDLPIGEPAHLDVPVRGLLAGQRWVPALCWDEATILARHLQTACLIVIAYLTGMRAEEVLHLESGCHRVEPIEGSTAVRHLIRGRHFKSAVDPDGNALPRGEYRSDPWVTIPPVGAAVAVAERLSIDGVLFPARRFNNPRSPLPAPRRPQLGRCLAPAVARDQIERFIHYANHLANVHHRPAERIPPDPAGPITLRRFRRTLAWFIHRLPRGQVALGVQYGHLAAVTGDGYAARAAAGLHNVLDVEEALALADTLTVAADRLTAGETVSGPAASATRRLCRRSSTATRVST